MRTDERIVMLPPFRVTRRVQMLAETKDYNHRLMNVPEIWKDSRGEGIKVAILDSGVPEHVDLAPVGGKSFIDGYYTDANGHSTHCGGIVAALCDNGMGVCGIAPAVDDWYGAVLDGNGSGSIDSVVAGIRWAVDEVGADIISMSLGIAIPFPIRQLEDACNYAVEHGVAVIAAAGNEAGKVGQPGMYDSVITVAAVNSKQQHAAFSNVGKEVDFATGGVDVYSTYLNNSYAVLSGTSMSTPAIAAIAALILAKHLKAGKKLTPEELRQHIKRIAYDVGGDGFDELYGHGIPIFRPGWDAEDGTPLPDPVITPPTGGGLFHKSSMGPAAGCQYWDLWTDFIGTVDGELAHKQDLQAALAEGIRRLARRTELVDRALRQKGT